MIACAGAGKSTTLAQRIATRIEKGVNPMDMVAITFTRKAAHELKQKLKRLNVEISYVGTVHAWALRKINELRDEPLTACPASLFEADIREEIRVSGKKISLNQVINATELDGFAWMILQRVRTKNEHRGIIDYDAILKRWLNEVVFGGREVPELFVDEFQDTGWDEFEIYSHAKHLTFVGDPRQCHPPDTMIEVDRGKFKKIHELNNGDKVRSWNQQAQKMIGNRTIKVESREYCGDMISVTVNTLAGSATVDSTPDHRFAVKWKNRKQLVWVTYLMYRKDYGYRVGWCQLFNTKRGCGGFHLAQRARLENADRVWILKVHTEKWKASAYESIIASKYGIPTLVFNPRHKSAYTKEFIDEVFRSVSKDAIPRGEQCLIDHGRNPGLPLYPWPGLEKGAPTGRRTVITVFASNLIPEMMVVPDPSKQLTWAEIKSVKSYKYHGKVFSLDVEKDHTYSANGVVVRNCLYSFRGADPERINLMAEIRRSQVVTLKQNFRCSPEIDAYAYKANAGDVAGTEASLEQIADEIVKLAPSKITVLCGYNATVDKLKALVSSRGVSVATSRPHAEVVKMEAVLRYLESGSDHLFEHALNLVDPDAYKRSKHQANQSLCSISEIITESEAWSEIGHEAYSLKQAMPDMSYGDLAEMVANQQTSGDVQIMTIHAAKGLEWDTVGFVDEMSSNSHHSRMRYVACTRARSRLIHWRLEDSR